MLETQREDAYWFKPSGAYVGPLLPGDRPPGAEQWPESPRSSVAEEPAILVWSDGNGPGTLDAHLRYRVFQVRDTGGERPGMQYIIAYSVIEEMIRGLVLHRQRHDGVVLVPFVSELGENKVAVGFDMRVS